MPASAPGYATRPEDAQCYNCGTSGHWAIACPEPTRETPAGLAAWRSTNNMGKGNNRDQHGTSKKAKGPIITKYAPPPSPAPTVNRYGPPPGYGQPPAPYPGPAPPYPPQYPPHSAPPPGYPPGYSPPTYPPQSYPQPSYGNAPLPPPPGPPPGPYGLPPPPLPPLPPHHAPHPAGSPPSYLPAYGPPPTSQPPQPYSSRPPYGPPYQQPISYSPHPPPSYPPSYPPSATPAYGLPPPPRPGPPPGPSSRLSSGSPPLSRHGPPKLSTLPAANKIHPSLPPRPPQSNRNVHEPSRDHRDHRNKKKHDRHNRNRDNRHKKGTPHSRSSDHKAPDHKAEGSRLRTEFKAQDASKPPPSHLPKEQPSSAASPKKSLETPATLSNRKHDDATEPNPESCLQSLSETRPELPIELGKPTDDISKTAEAELEEAPLLNVPDSPRLPEVTSHDSEEHLPPNTWDAEGDESKSDALIENVEEFFKLLHDHSDPPFERDDGLRRDSLPKSHTEGSQIERDTCSDSGDVNEHPQHVYSGDHTPEKRPAKRQRSSSPPYQSPRRRENHLPERPRDNFVPRPRKVHRPEESDKRSTDVPHASRRRSPDRRRPYEREPSRSRSPSSRRSSVSVASSGLDSLEAELLGRPDKARTPEDTNKRRQSGGNNKPKKRQPRLDSAYSRRW